MDVGHDGEVLGGHAAPPAPQRDRAHDGADRRSQRARVDELAGAETGRVRPPPGGHAAPDDRDHVGRGAAHVEEERVGKRARHEGRARHPVGGRHSVRSSPRRLRRSESSVDTVDPRLHVGERGAKGVEHEDDTFPLGREAIGQLGGHGDGHRARAPQAVGRLGQDRRQEVRFAPEGERALEHPRLGLPVFPDASDLEVGPAHVPAEDRTVHERSSSEDRGPVATIRPPAV